jgi:hypothetical protein
LRSVDWRPLKVVSKVFRAALHRLIQCLWSASVGSGLMTVGWARLSAACSFGNWRRVCTVWRMGALVDLIAFVVQAAWRISASRFRNGSNSAYAVFRSLVVAGYLRPRVASSSTNRSMAVCSVAAV